MSEEIRTLTGLVLNDDMDISLCEICQVCGVTAEHILDMVDEGVIAPQTGKSPRRWRFGGKAVTRVQVALRLQRDLRVNLAGAALILDLLEELQELRRLPKHRTL
jgi:chaperone modulatory protein CbpM